MTEVFVSANVGVHWQPAKIVEIVPQTRRIKSFFFSLSKPFIHRAGQHVDLRLTAPDGYSAMRSYSIASPPGAAAEIELAIERLDDGEVSPFFHDVADIGDEIELRGPFGGHFVWSTIEGGPLLLIGGGSGVVPLMAMLRHLRARSGQHTYGAAAFSDTMGRRALSRRARRNGPAIPCLHTRSYADPGTIE